MVLSIVLQIKRFFLVKILTCVLVPSDLKIHDVGSEEKKRARSSRSSMTSCVSTVTKVFPAKKFKIFTDDAYLCDFRVLVLKC